MRSSEFNYLPVICFLVSRVIDFSLKTPSSAVREKSKATWKETAIIELELGEVSDQSEENTGIFFTHHENAEKLDRHFDCCAFSHFALSIHGKIRYFVHFLWLQFSTFHMSSSWTLVASYVRLDTLDDELCFGIVSTETGQRSPLFAI